MFAARVILLAGVLALWPLGSAQADDLTPLPDQATPVPVATQPAPPPSSDVPPTEAPVVASPSTAPDTNPAPVQQEHNGTVKIDQPPASVPTQAAVGPEVQPAAPLPVQAVRGAHRAPLPAHPYAGPSAPSEALPQTLPRSPYRT